MYTFEIVPVFSAQLFVYCKLLDDIQTMRV